ncbi:MAG: NrdH-redoxin [Nitriliruptor sp.]|nr:MAG: NrdH-redoxin [Nitriliruptor sp.]TVR20837.1 MAG: NrdH-redoxin [Nitriliruptor sp.]
MPTAPEPTAASTATTITVYWRPGCGFCSRLLRWIDRAGVPTTRRNIWEDPEAAAAVRAATGGDETVPTVTIGQRTLVNPSPRALQAAIAAQAPELLPDGPEPSRHWWERTARSG